MQTLKYDVSKKIRKILKKCAPIFSKVGSKESQENTKDKVGLRQADILNFQWSNLNKIIF
jgi:hypothetical protein